MKKINLIFTSLLMSYLFNSYLYNTFDFRLIPLEAKMWQEAIMLIYLGTITLIKNEIIKDLQVVNKNLKDLLK